jgi:UrcA family protein
MYRNPTSVTKTLQIAWGVVASAAVAWGGGSSTAQAGEPDTPVAHEVVSFKDLNLNTPAGVAVLYRRIKIAAHDVCADPYRYDLSEYKLRPCIDDAVSRAIAQVNNPMLTSLYEAKPGKGDKKPTVLASAR